MTLIIKSLAKLKIELKKNNSKILNFVPTMGNLHKGHISLIKKAKFQKSRVLVSIFVNPLQFGEKKDFVNYPRTLKEDIELLKKLSVDIVFTPEKSFSFSKFSLISKNINNKLCAIDRPNHFNGVAYIILKFLLLIKPNYIFLGKKDYQQTLLIKEIIEEFNLETKIKLVSTVRQKDGTAISSRNTLISSENNHLMKEIYKTLQLISNEIKNQGITYSRINSLKKELLSKGFDKINYLEILNSSNLVPISDTPCKAVVFVSLTVDGIRLIDNVELRNKVKKKKNLIISF